MIFNNGYRTQYAGHCRVLCLCLVALALILNACANKGEDCTVSVKTVFAQNGEPMAGVSVSVGGEELGVTAEDGMVEKTIKLSYGTHIVVCSADGYRKSSLKMVFEELSEESAKEVEMDLMNEIGALAAEYDYVVKMERKE